MRTERINFNDFMKGDWKEKRASMPFLSAGLVAGASLTPTSVLAVENDDTFGELYKSVMTLFDGGVVLVIVFAGACWSLGWRTKALEILIGVCAGYLLARHAIHIRDWLRGIGK